MVYCLFEQIFSFFVISKAVGVENELRQVEEVRYYRDQVRVLSTRLDVFIIHSVFSKVDISSQVNTLFGVIFGGKYMCDKHDMIPIMPLSSLL